MSSNRHAMKKYSVGSDLSCCRFKIVIRKLQCVRRLQASVVCSATSGFSPSYRQSQILGHNKDDCYSYQQGYRICCSCVFDQEIELHEKQSKHKSSTLARNTDNKFDPRVGGVRHMLRVDHSHHYKALDHTRYNH